MAKSLLMSGTMGLKLGDDDDDDDDEDENLFGNEDKNWFVNFKYFKLIT